MKPHEKKPAAMSREHVKERYHAFFVALHADAKRAQGGITDVAHRLGLNPTVYSNGINPNNLGTWPTAATLLDALVAVQSVRALNALALDLGRVSVPVDAVGRSPGEALAVFLALVKASGEAVALAAEALADGRLSADEREALLPLMDGLVASAVEMAAVVRS